MWLLCSKPTTLQPGLVPAPKSTQTQAPPPSHHWKVPLAQGGLEDGSAFHSRAWFGLEFPNANFSSTPCPGLGPALQARGGGALTGGGLPIGRGVGRLPVRRGRLGLGVADVRGLSIGSIALLPVRLLQR